MVVASLCGSGRIFTPVEGRRQAVCKNDRDQARRENKETETGHVAN
jgi:hypothetical protein